MFNVRKFLNDQYHRVIHLRDTPHSVACGVAIGIFMGFMPFLGLKTLITLVIAWFTRCSKLAAVVALSLHDVLWLVPLLPPWLVRVQYQIGFFILNHELPPGLHFHSHHVHWHVPTLAQISAMWEGFDSDKWMYWERVVHIGYPMLLGAIVMGVPLAIVFYFITLKLVARHQAHRAEMETAQEADARAKDKDARR